MLCGILFVLHTGTQREFLPQELGFGLGMTRWRRLAEWHQAGVLDRLHQPLEAVPPVRRRVGRPRRRPEPLPADRGYDHDKYRRLVWAKGIKPVIARRGAPHGSGAGCPPDTSSSAPSACCTGSAVCAPAGKPATTSTRRSSPSPHPSSAGDASPADSVT